MARCRGGGQAIEQVVRVEGDDRLIAAELGGDGLHGAGPAFGLSLDDDLAGTELEPDRAGPVRDE